MVQGIGYTGRVPIENDAVKVVVQDQTTPPFVGYLLQSQSSFQLASSTQKSTLTTLYKTATLVAGHGVSANDKILISDTISGNSIFATVKTVATNDITIDRPWDFAFPITSLCQIVKNDMAVNGAITEQIYAVQIGAVPADIYGINISVISSSEPDDSLFGDRAELPNGICLRIYDGYDKVIGCPKTNGEMARFGSGGAVYKEKAGGGEWSTNVYIPIREQWGVPLRLSGGAQIQAIVQDDLSSQTNIFVSFVGQYTAGETM